MLKKIPNILTIGRIIIVPFFVLAFYLPGFYGDLTALILFIIASFTDFLDGMLARMLGQESKLGELLDPIADKIIVATALILLVMDGTIRNYEVIAAIIILTREILISGLREFLAKGKFRNSGNETFFHDGKEYKFTRNDPTLFFLQRIRDESHRFAISAHRAKRKKGISKSLLDQIEGIGAIRKRALLNHFGSARSVESASLDEIKSVEGVEEKVAKKIYNFFHE